MEELSEGGWVWVLNVLDEEDEAADVGLERLWLWLSLSADATGFRGTRRFPLLGDCKSLGLLVYLVGNGGSGGRTTS